METRFVRLKPYDKRRGQLLRRYSVKRKRFLQGKWYEVPFTLAEYLETITSKPEDPTTPLAFDIVMTKADAVRMVKREKMIRERATAENPELMTLTTGDLRGDDIREVDISADDPPEPVRDPLRNARMSETEALTLLDDDAPPARSHSVTEATTVEAKPARRKPAAKTKAKTKRGKAKSTRGKAKSAASAAPTAMPSELDAANWEDEQPDPFS